MLVEVYGISGNYPKGRGLPFFVHSFNLLLWMLFCCLGFKKHSDHEVECYNLRMIVQREGRNIVLLWSFHTVLDYPIARLLLHKKEIHFLLLKLLWKKSFTRNLASFIRELWVSDLGERLQFSTVVSQLGLCSLDLELFVFGYLNQNIS